MGYYSPLTCRVCLILKWACTPGSSIFFLLIMQDPTLSFIAENPKNFNATCFTCESRGFALPNRVKCPISGPIHMRKSRFDMNSPSGLDQDQDRPRTEWPHTKQSRGFTTLFSTVKGRFRTFWHLRYSGPFPTLDLAGDLFSRSDMQPNAKSALQTRVL